jgi:mannosyltransferase
MNDQQRDRSVWQNPSLLAILILGATLRLLSLGRQSVWIDEGFSWLATRLSFWDVTQLSFADVHPPLYYFLLKMALWILPSTEFGLRLPSAIFSIATLIVMIGFVNRHWGHRTACYVGLLAALSPFDIYYAQEARMYSLLAFLFVLAFTQLVDAIQGRPVCLIGWVIACIGLAWIHAYGVLAVFIQLGFVFCFWTWHRLRHLPMALKSRPLLAAFTCACIGIAPIVILFWMIRANASGSVLIPAPTRLLYLIRYWTAGPMDAFPAYKIPWRMRDASAVVMAGCAIWGACRLWRRGVSYQWILHLTAALLLLPPLVIYGYSVLTGKGLWIDRGFLGSAYIFYLLAGVGLSKITSRMFRGLAAAVIAASILSGELYYYTKFQKSQAAAAFHSLPPASPQWALLITPPWRNCEACYYLGPQISFWAVSPENSQQLLRDVWPNGQMPQAVTADCNDAQLQSASAIYAFGDPSTIRAERKQWPSCLSEKTTWIFEDAHWRSIDQ